MSTKKKGETESGSSGIHGQKESCFLSETEEKICAEEGLSAEQKKVLQTAKRIFAGKTEKEIQKDFEAKIEAAKNPDDIGYTHVR